MASDASDVRPLVSVVMPVYDIESYVTSAIASVMSQTMSNWELICVDDGSSDGSREICESFSSIDKRINVVLQEHAGAGVARNRGISLSRGEYVYFLDGDDMLVPDALERCVKVADSQEADIVQFEARVLVQDGAFHDARQYTRSCAYPGVWRGCDLYLEQCWAGDYITQACMYLTSVRVFERLGVAVCSGDDDGHGAYCSDGAMAGDVNVEEAKVDGGSTEHESPEMPVLHVFSEGVIHEDESGTFSILMAADRVVCLRDKLYIRRYRPGSIMTSRDWRASAKGYFRTYALAFSDEVGMARSDEHARAYARHLEVQAANCIDCFYRTGLPLGDFSSAVGARECDREALESLLSRRELDARWFKMLRAKRLLRTCLSGLKHRALAGRQAGFQRQGDDGCNESRPGRDG